MSKANKTQTPPAKSKSSGSRLNNLKKRSALMIIGVIGVVVLLFTSVGFVGGTLLEEHNDFCTSCHTVTETTYFNRATAAIADTTVKVSDLATVDFRQAETKHEPFQCITCHRGD